MENQPLNFAMIGAAGYIAPRHMKAIRENGHNLVAALDPYDGVGIIDSYFPEADFFIEPERFDRHLDKLRRLTDLKNGTHRKVDYVTICSPNYMHDSHIRLALRNNAFAICEKPLVLNPWNLDALQEIERETGKKVFTILQVRLHPVIKALHDRIMNSTAGKVYNIDLTYITSRGKWYARSWKGNIEKSGGIATNIGIHFFDLLTWIFGNVQESKVNLLKPDKAAGILLLKKARVRWFLSLDYMDNPEAVRARGLRTYRSLLVENEEIEFSEGFSDLHTESYRHLLTGPGFGIKEARNSVEISHDIRNSIPIGIKGDYHPLLKKVKI